MTKQQENNKNKPKQEKKVQRNQKPEQQEELQMERQPEKISAEKVRETAVNPTDASPAALQAVQRAYGNQYVQRMAQQQGGRVAPNAPALTARNGRLQPKLTVNDPDDQYEKEAEAVSEKVSRAPEHTPPIGSPDGGGNGGNGGSDSGNGNSGQAAHAVGKFNPQRQTAVQGGNGNGTAVQRSVPTQLRGKLFDTAQRAESPEIDEEAGSDVLAKAPPEHVPNIGIDGGEVQRSDLGYDQQSGAVNSGIESQISSKSSGGGQPLADPVRNKMEGHMGSDFSGVKVHNDSDSHSLNRSLNARAFTTGNNIFFSKDEYQPNTQGGQKLIAHELTHVVQQGAAPQKAQRAEAEEEDVQREEAAPEEEMAQRSEAAPEEEMQLMREAAPEEEMQLMRETAVQRAILQREEQKTAESQSASSTISGEVSKAGPHQKAVTNIITPMLSRSPLTIQRDDKEEKEAERKKMKEKMSDGKSKASNKKQDKQSKKEEKKEKGGQAGKKKVESKARKPEPEPNPKIRQPKKVESKGKVNTEENERPEVQGETGSLGWPPTKHSALPDWDGETKKYENFKNGDFASLGIDLSELEGDTTGLDSAITVDDPEIRKQMVQDALSGGLGGDGDLVSDKNMALATITDSIPFAGQLMSASKFMTEGPGAWWESTSEGFKNAAANISSAWKGMGEGSGWNRAASALELVIGLLEMLNNIMQFVSMVALIVLIVLGIIFGIGTALMATVFFAGVGASMVGFSSPLIPIAAAILGGIAQWMIVSNLIIRVLREIVIAFRIIDILYFESDPDKLMERQAKLAGHVSGQNQAAHENITPGINKEEKKDPNEGLVGADELEEPLVTDPSIERVNRMNDDEKQDYKTAWMKKYGVTSTADQVRESFMSEDVLPPPLIEYGADKENDVITKVDRNAIAIIELKKQRLGLEEQKQETDQAREIAGNQKEVIGSARDSVAADQETMDVHQKDIKKKQGKQDELKSTTEDTGGKGQDGGGKGVKAKGLAGLILKLLMPLMPAMSKAGENVDAEKKQKTKEGPDTTLQGTDATVDSAKKGSQEADSRKQKTKKAEAEAKQSAQTAEATSAFLEDQEGLVDEGLGQLEGHSEELGTTISSVASEEERLIQERTEALNEAVTWMEEWRARRMEIFSAMEEKLEERLPEEEEKEGEEGEGEEKKEKWDIYDDQADQGELEGDYFSAGMKTAETEEGEEEFAV